MTMYLRGEKMKHERYIINDEEIELLERYEGITNQRKDPHRYDTFPVEALAALCRMKDRSNDMYYRRYQAAMDVIDLVYSHKDEIIEKVVDRATKEIVRKGLPKLLERGMDNDSRTGDK